MARTRIRMLVRADVQGSILQPNAEVECDTAEAQLWVSAGMAEIIGEVSDGPAEPPASE